MSLTTSSTKVYLSHDERTADDFRDTSLHQVRVHRVHPVNDHINTYQLAVEDKQNGIKFLPGQWLDVHIPGLKKPGGFTITSTPTEALPRSGSLVADSPFLELAVQNSPENPAAAWLWQPVDKIIGTALTVRVGGSFVWPPKEVDLDNIKRTVFIAGGVGINPLISMISHIHQLGSQQQQPREIRMLYSTKVPNNCRSPSDILFLTRLLMIFASLEHQPRCMNGHLQLFLTINPDGSQSAASRIESYVNSPSTTSSVSASIGRITDAELLDVVGQGKDERSSSVYYVCGPPGMTDHVVEFLRSQEDVGPQQVLCEKWW